MLQTDRAIERWRASDNAYGLDPLGHVLTRQTSAVCIEEQGTGVFVGVDKDTSAMVKS